MDKFRKLIRITVTMVSAVLLLTIFGFYFISIKAQQDDTREEVEKVSENQQVLSQQILKNVLLLIGENTQDDSLTIHDLRSTLAIFQKQRQFLVQNVSSASPGNDEEIKLLNQIIKQNEPFYNRIVGIGYTIIDTDIHSTIYSEAYLQNINKSEIEFLNNLDRVSSIARKNQDVLGEQIYWINASIFAALIVALLVLAFLVITPIFKSSISDYKSLLIAKNKAEIAGIERTKMVNDLIFRNRGLEQFAYIVSHNLRAPVANIIGALDVLSIGGLTPEERDTFTTGLRTSVTKLDNVVSDLNKVLQVKLEVNENKEIVSFSKLVEDIKTSIVNLITGDISIVYDFSESDSFFTLRSYLYSIFFNLITNSIKYRRPQVPLIIKIKSYQMGDKIILIFTDNGMGIDLTEKKDQIFGLYKRFHPNIEGKGMGLFMVKTQVETLGGEISVTSTVNKGIEFIIDFKNG